MSRPWFILLPLGLLLWSCDKPNHLASRKHSEASEQDVSALRHASVRRSGEPSTASDPIEELRNRLAEAEAMPSSDAREKALADVVWNAMELQPEIAQEAYLKLSATSPEKLRLMRHYAMRAAAANPEEALKWALSLESETQISAAISHIALELAAEDPVRAASLLSDSGMEGRDLDVAVVQVVQRWAASSPPDAVAWVETFAAGDARQASLQAIFERWLVQDPGAAIGWVQSTHEGTLRTEAQHAISAVLLQQPESTRNRWLEQDTTGFLSKIPLLPETMVKE